jgi:hypothetical protein
VTPVVRAAINRNKRVYKKWIQRGRQRIDKHQVNLVQKQTNNIIKNAKQEYIDNLSAKICDPRSGGKIFWNAYKRLINKKKNTNIPPILGDDDSFISNFQRKAEMFNGYFANQCRPFDIDSNLPPFTLKTHNTLSDIDFTCEQIHSIISKLNSKKAHGCDNISISLLKLCSKEIAYPLKLIFSKCLASGVFPDSWKLANVQPVHKKDSRQKVSNYRPISLLPIFGKIFEKIMYDSMYSFFRTNKLINKNQSGFIPGDSTINQLLSITTEIYEAFESYDEIRAVFLDMSKAFDKVWHEGLIFKLKQNGINGKALKLLENYLSNRKQRVVLNGLQSEWNPILSGVPQGSILGPLLFLIFINDLTDNIHSSIRLYADDSSLFARVRNSEATHDQLTTDLDTITKWAILWKMKFNPEISKQAIEVIFSAKYKKPFHPHLDFNGIPVARETSTKHLGIILDERLTFRKHIKEAISKAKKASL